MQALKRLDKPRQQEFGWNRQQIAEALSLAAISVAFLFAFYRRDLWPLRAAKNHRVFHGCFDSTKGLIQLSIERFKTVQRLG